MPESSIQYRGRVSIKPKDKPSKRSHNEGTYHLFNLINRIFSKALGDETDIVSHLPMYITIVYEDDKLTEENLRTTPDYTDKYKQNSVLIKELPIISKEIRENTVYYNCLLTSSIINSFLPSNVNKGFALLLNSCDEILAFSSIDLETIKQMKDKELGQSDIEWSMSFSNSQEVEKQ